MPVSIEDLERAAEGLVTDDTEPVTETKPSTESLAEEVKEVKEEVKEEVKKPDNVEDEPTDNIARSKLGRRFSALESKFDTLLERLESQSLNHKEKSELEIDNDIDLDEPLTRRAALELVDKRDKDKKLAESRHTTDYNAEFALYSQNVEEDPDALAFHEKVMAELVKNHNVKRSNNGREDAKWNYLNAKIAVLETDRKTPKNPLEKNKDKEIKGLGSPSETKITSHSAPVIKLDPDAQGFVDYVRKEDPGWTDDKVSNILNSEPKARMMRNKR